MIDLDISVERIIKERIISMSNWSSINGIIQFGYGAYWRDDLAEPIMKYIVDKAVFTGSEGNAEVKISNKTFSSRYDIHEIMIKDYDKNIQFENIQVIDSFTVTIKGNLRDRDYNETIKEFNDWINFINKTFPRFFTIDIEYLNIDFDEEEGKYGLLVIDNRKVTEYKSENYKIIEE
jgi:hypothetical protein